MSMYLWANRHSIIGVWLSVVLILVANMLSGYFNLPDSSDCNMVIVLLSFWIIIGRITWKYVCVVPLALIVIGIVRVMIMSAYPVLWVYNTNWRAVLHDELIFQMTVQHLSAMVILPVLICKLGLVVLGIILRKLIPQHS